MEIDTATKAAIIGAAYASASAMKVDPDIGFDATVAMQAAAIAAQLGDSPVSRAIDQVADSKVFAATITGISKEKSSTRGLVQLKTKPSKFNEDGRESARTERTDNPVGRAMARRIQQDLIGHRVLVHIEIETYNDGAGKVRVIRHVTDLGVDGDTAVAAA